MKGRVLDCPHPIYSTVHNPKIPYTGALPIIEDGMMIIIGGRVNSDANRFSINLCDTSQGGSDMALHLNPRFERTNGIIRNSFHNLQWGSEERYTPTFPLHKRAYFECIILVQQSCYKIAFNGAHFCDYNHRQAVEAVKFLNIMGAVTIQSVQCIAPLKSRHQQQQQQHEMLFQFMPPMLPFNTHIDGGFCPGKMIMISAKVMKFANRFAIELLVPSDEKQCVVFHFNPRYNWLWKDYVVRNSYLHGKWGTEETEQPYFPFQKGVTFDMVLLCKVDRFQVVVNQAHFVDYAHRFSDLNAITRLKISGDLTIVNVRLK